MLGPWLLGDVISSRVAGRLSKITSHQYHLFENTLKKNVAKSLLHYHGCETAAIHFPGTTNTGGDRHNKYWR